MQGISKATLLYLLILGYPSQLFASPDTDNQTNFQPFETRDQNVFNLIHGQALPTNAHLNKKSQSIWSSSLVITNALNIESNINEKIYLDYEAYRFTISYQYGLNDNWNIKLDAPLIFQSGGYFDSSMDGWHNFLDLPRANRPFVENNQYNIRFDYQTQTSINFNENSHALGDAQIALARSIKNNNTAMSLWMSLKLPTGDEDKLTGNGATDFSTWLALNQQLSNNWLINLNAGIVFLGGSNYKNIPLSNQAIYGHIMLGKAITENINLKLQLQGHTSYYDQSPLRILSTTYLLNFGGSIKINQCHQLDIAMSEDIKVDASPDTSLLINWRYFTLGHLC